MNTTILYLSGSGWFPEKNIHEMPEKHIGLGVLLTYWELRKRGHSLQKQRLEAICSKGPFPTRKIETIEVEEEIKFDKTGAFSDEHHKSWAMQRNKKKKGYKNEGAELKALRMAKGLSLEQLGNILDRDPEVLLLAESGEKPVIIKKALDYLRSLGDQMPDLSTRL